MQEQSSSPAKTASPVSPVASSSQEKAEPPEASTPKQDPPRPDRSSKIKPRENVTTNYILSFDKLSHKNASAAFNPTLSLLMVPQSEVSSNANIRTEDDGKSSGKNNQIASDGRNPQQIYVGIRDRIIELHRHQLLAIILLVIVSSMILLAIGLWIEIGFRDTFAGLMLKTEPTPSFPVHYSLFINVIFGVLGCIILFIAKRRKNSRKMSLMIIICLICCIWAGLTSVFSFGANIFYEDELEAIMANDTMNNGQYPEESMLWNKIQNSRDCCGIKSFKSWSWRKRSNDVKNDTSVYPSTCCKPSSNGTRLPCELNGISRKKGCLESETDVILAIAYVSCIISIIHCQLLIVSAMVMIKMFCRQRLLEDVDLELEMSSLNLNTDGNAATTGNATDKGISASLDGDLNIKTKLNADSPKVKRSPTL